MKRCVVCNKILTNNNLKCTSCGGDLTKIPDVEDDVPNSSNTQYEQKVDIKEDKKDVLNGSNVQYEQKVDVKKEADIKNEVGKNTDRYKKFIIALAAFEIVALVIILIVIMNKKDDTNMEEVVAEIETEEATTEEPTELETTEEATLEEPTEETTPEATLAAEMEAPSTDGWDESKKIYAYSWDEDFMNRMEIVLAHYPEYRDYVEFVYYDLGGTSDEYMTIIDECLTQGEENNYPSLFAADENIAKYWSEDDTKTANLFDLGLTAETFANSYDFAMQYSTYNGQLKCATWQICPGSVFYRRDIAMEVLGTDNPDDVQAALEDWDTFLALAETMKEAGYKIVSSPEDVRHAILDAPYQTWVTETTDGPVLTLDATVYQYLELGKLIYDCDYTDNTYMWDDTWVENMKYDAKVFCYFGCPWFIDIMTGCGATYGNWGAVVGPASYHWGGTYVCVGKDTNNPELCAFLVYALTCDTEVMIDITNQTGDCVNNKEANSRLINGELSADNDASLFLCGQNPIEVWAEAAEGLDLSNVTYQDFAIKEYIDNAARFYNEGEYASIDEAVKYIQDIVSTELGMSTFE